MSSALPRSRAATLGDPGLRKSLEEVIRRKVPASEVDDIVQATLTEAIASASAPDDAESLRKWVYGIARHKIADYHRKSRRERPEESPEAEAPQAPHSASDLLRWAEKELPEGEAHQQTLEWLLREGEGEKLESIATSEKLPAPRVRQRVTRLRKHFRARWEAQLAALVAVLGAAVVAWWLLRDRQPKPEIVHEPAPPVPSADPSFERAREMRRLALESCQKSAWAECLEGLDRARALDPTGDGAPEIVEARKAIAAGLAPPPPSAPLVVPTGTTLPSLAPAPTGVAAPTGSAGPSGSAAPLRAKPPGDLGKGNAKDFEGFGSDSLSAGSSSGSGTGSWSGGKAAPKKASPKEGPTKMSK